MDDLGDRGCDDHRDRLARRERAQSAVDPAAATISVIAILIVAAIAWRVWG
jgi:hypothetical protein